MVTPIQDLQMYRDFDELASDLLALAKEILPDQLIYLSSFSDKQQIVLKLSDIDTSILLTEGMTIDLEETACSRIDFDKKQPLVYEDIRDENCTEDVRRIFEDANIKSYLGIPISRVSGERFGTLCAVHHKESQFDNKSINLLQKIVRMFSYYLELERFAYMDALTELYNRRYLTKFFEDDTENGGALFFLDLDGFKKVNDIHGHDRGDLVLKEVASRLQKFADEHTGAFAVRLGGDEFIVYFPDISSKEEMSKLAERILVSLNTWDTAYQLSVSIGITFYPSGSNANFKTHLKNGDQALYRAKKAGKNTFVFF